MSAHLPGASLNRTVPIGTSLNHVALIGTV
jgi:hypothetical protein